MKPVKQQRNKIYLYENFVNERNFEKIADENEINKLLSSMCLTLLDSAVTISFSAILGMSEINLMNAVLFVFASTNFASTLFFYNRFIKNALNHNLFKRKLHAFILPLPMLLLAFFIFALGTYNSILTLLNRRDLIFLGTWNIFFLVFALHLAYLVFQCYAYINCFSDYILKRKPRLDQAIHR